MGPHDHPESGGVPELQLGQVEHQIADSVVDGRVQDRTGVRRAADVEAAPDDQLDVVAPDVHMRSPIDGLSALDVYRTDCLSCGEVAACKRTDTEFTREGESSSLAR